MDLKHNATSEMVASENISVVVFCALDEEFEPLQKKLTVLSHHTLANFEYIKGAYREQIFVVIKTGIGMVNTASAVTAFIQLFNPTLLLFVGIAGALDHSLNIGDVVIAERCLYAEGLSHQKLATNWTVSKASYNTIQALLANLPADTLITEYQVKLGTLVSSDIFPAPHDFEKIFKNEQAIAIDMETAAFYQICDAFAKPCLAIRGISNTVASVEDDHLDYVSIVKAAYHAANCCFHILDCLNPLLAFTVRGLIIENGQL